MVSTKTDGPKAQSFTSCLQWCYLFYFYIPRISAFDTRLVWRQPPNVPNLAKHFVEFCLFLCVCVVFCLCVFCLSSLAYSTLVHQYPNLWRRRALRSVAMHRYNSHTTSKEISHTPIRFPQIVTTTYSHTCRLCRRLPIKVRLSNTQYSNAFHTAEIDAGVLTKQCPVENLLLWMWHHTGPSPHHSRPWLCPLVSTYIDEE